jgi:hypothetical protein
MVVAQIESKKVEKFNVQDKKRKICQPSKKPPGSNYEVMIISLNRREGREVSKFVYFAFFYIFWQKFFVRENLIFFCYIIF